MRNWIYTSSNSNFIYLILIIAILLSIVLYIGVNKFKSELSRSSDNFGDINESDIYASVGYKLNNDDVVKWSSDWILKNERNSETPLKELDKFSNDIPFDDQSMNIKSMLYGGPITDELVGSNNNVNIGMFASMDSTGNAMTDTLGGIKFDYGYSVLDESIGTFKNTPAMYQYNNIMDYKTGMNKSCSDSYGGIGNCMDNTRPPVFLQKDFAGVANIFAPNIIINGSPVEDDGIPNISMSF